MFDLKRNSDKITIKIDDLWYREEIKGEIHINKINLILSFVMIIITITNAVIVFPGNGFQINFIVNLIGVSVFAIYNIIIFYNLKKNNYKGTFKYSTVFVSITIISSVLVSYSLFSGWVHTLRTSTFLTYFIIIVMSGFYRRPRMPIITSLLAILEYSIIFFYVVFFTETNLSNLETFQTEAISYDVYVLFVSILLSVGFLVSYSSARFKSLLNRSLLSETETTFIKDTFGQYVDEKVRDELLSGRLELGGVLKECSVLFIDIRNFTELSRRISPEEVVYLLNKFFTEMVDEVIDNNGITNKFIGDAMLAVFRIPLKEPNHYFNAVKAAIGMKEKLKSLNAELLIEGREQLQIGIGIHTGMSLAGNIGSEQRKEYTVIGETVNLASRIENLNKRFNTEILISSETYEKVKDTVEVKEIGPVSVRGLTEPITVYNVLSLRE